MQENSENFTKIINRLQQYVDYKGISFNKIAQNINVSNSYFSKMLKNNGDLGENVIKKTLLYYEDINSDWLITGRGLMLRDSHEYNRYVKNNSVVGGNLSGNGNNINQNNTAELIDELRAQLLAKDKQIERLLAIIDKMSATD